MLLTKRLSPLPCCPKTYNEDTDSVEFEGDGTKASPLKAVSKIEHKFFLNRAGRAYCFANDQWISQTDDIYGAQYVNYTESADLGTSPIIEWENRGDFIRAGTTIEELTVRGRFDNGNELNDLILAAYLVVPNDPAMLQGAGINSDAHFTAIELFNYSWYNGLDGNEPLGVEVGSMGNKLFQRKIPVNYVVTQDAELRLFYKPVSKSPRPSTATRFFIHSTSWLLSLNK